jgi:hypothetical protein
MLSPETLESYRRMTPSERLQLTFELCRPAWRALTEGDPMIVERRFERLRQENDLRNQRICEGFRRSEQMLGLVNEEPDQWEKMDG